MKFLWTAVNVKDMDESIKFYSSLLELQVMNQFSPGSNMKITFMGNGIDNETQLELMEDSNNRDVEFGEHISVGFAVESLDNMLEKKVRDISIPVHSGPFETPGSKYFFCVKDPNG